MQSLNEQFRAIIFTLSLKKFTVKKYSDKWTLFVERGDLT